ncbi:MAG: hypothetical protein RR677_06500 [Acinetobacter sp.]
MSEIETNGYLTCSQCNSLNRVKEIGQQGIYKCGTCKRSLLVVNKEKKEHRWVRLLVISFFIGGVGSLGIDKIQEILKPTEISYSVLNTSWTTEQEKHFDLKCKAFLTTRKPNWSSEKIAKTCTCYVSFIAENTEFPVWGKLSEAAVSAGSKECQ